MKPTVKLLGNQALLDGETIVDSPKWFEWLDGEENSTFAFYPGNSAVSNFSARREERERGGYYWSAYKRIQGKLKKTYLGKSSELTLDRLKDASARLLNPGKLPNASGRLLDEDEADERDDDGVEPTDDQVIKFQAQKIQDLQGELKYLAHKLDAINPERLRAIADELLADSTLTRGARDRGTVRRAIAKFITHLGDNHPQS